MYTMKEIIKTPPTKCFASFLLSGKELTKSFPPQDFIRFMQLPSLTARRCNCTLDALCKPTRTESASSFLGAAE